MRICAKTLPRIAEYAWCVVRAGGESMVGSVVIKYVPKKEEMFSRRDAERGCGGL